MSKYTEYEKEFDILSEQDKRKRTRVAEYTVALYSSAIRCQMDIQNIDAKSYLNEKFKPVIYKAALHAMSPLNYEKAIHDTENWINDFENKFFDGVESMTPTLERKEDIKLAREIFEKAIEIDDYLMNTKSEQPFNDMARAIILKTPAESEINLVVEVGIHDIKEIYIKYKEDIRQVEVPIAYVRRRKNRPMMLTYEVKPYLKDLSRCVLTARPVFFDEKHQEIEFKQFKEMFTKRDMLMDLFSYFLYEAADMIRRLEAYDIYLAYMNLWLLPGAVQDKTIVERYKEMYEDFNIDKNSIRLVASAEDSGDRTKQFIDNVKAFMDYGVVLRPMEDNELTIKTTHTATEIIKIINEDMIQ